MRASSTLKLSLVTVVFLAACGGSKASDATVAVKTKITIGSTTDPTSEMISEIYGQALEKASFRVARKKPYATNAELLKAMASGDVQFGGLTSLNLFDLVNASGSTATPGTTAGTSAGTAPATTGPTTAAPGSVPSDISAQAAAIAKALPASLKMTTPTTAGDKDVMFCLKTFTDANKIATLTDLGTKPGIATLAAPDGFDKSTPLGTAGLKDVYKIEFKAIVPTPIAGILATLNSGKADCGVGRSADPALSDSTLTVLQDDKALVPDNVIVPVVSVNIGADDVITVIDDTSARLTPASFRSLMARLKVDKASPEIIANEFIGKSGG